MWERERERKERWEDDAEIEKGKRVEIRPRENEKGGKEIGKYDAKREWDNTSGVK